MYTGCLILSLVITVGYAKVDMAMLSNKTKELIETLHDTCMLDTKVDPTLIDAAKEGNISDDPNLQCYSKCILTGSSIMDENGQINTTVLDDLLPDDIKESVKQSMESCGQKADQENLCERAHNISKCSYEEQLVFI